ncbi:hypothetical protein [Arthrobacter sp. H14]|uniref:hypothetical protein n=1 Tax=Arthrobacter sp. H14 TaxID=1312959 RepID=UPI00047919DB|nr:hypothetical protein [Arthrobacter sp. H14]
MKKTLSTLAISCGIVLAATGCTTGAEQTSGSEPEAIQAPASSPAPESAPAPEPSPESPSPAPEVEESLVEFGETWEYEDGIAVTVTHAGAAQASQYASGADETGGQMRLFKITIENGTDGIFDPAGAYTTVNYGDTGKVAERVFDSGQGYGDMWQGKILPGKEQSLTLPFAVPTDKAYEVLLSVAPGFEYEDAIFLGTVGK